MRLKIFYILIAFMFAANSTLSPQEPDESTNSSEGDIEIIQNLEILQELELAQNLELLEDYNVIKEMESQESQGESDEENN